MSDSILDGLYRDIDRELNRRNFLRLAGAGGIAAAFPKLSRAAEGVAFRMDRINAIHYQATHFIPEFLTKPIDWQFKEFATSGHGRVSAFTRGAIDGFGSGWNYLVTLAAEDLPGVCVCGVGGGGSRVLAAKGRDDIKRISDLKGKKVGVVKFSSQDVMLIYALEQHGIDPFNDVERVNLGNPAGVVAGMAGGDVEACAIWEPYGSIILLNHGGSMVSDLGSESFGRSHGGLFVRNGFIQKYPDLTQDVVNATVKATDYILSNKDKWAENARKVTGQSQEVVEAAIANSYPDTKIPLKTIRLVAQSIYELGIRKKDYSDVIHNYVDYTFLERATGKPKEELGYVA